MIRGITTREDGFIFGGYHSKNSGRKDRRGKPMWYSPQGWENKRQGSIRRHRTVRAWITNRIDRVKRFKGCAHCRYKKNPVALQFHHVDPSTKIENVACMRRSSYKQWGKIKTEMRKCIVLCANCHSIETQESYRK
jgi:hypothetical protein